MTATPITVRSAATCLGAMFIPAQSKTYPVVQADTGHTLRVRVTAAIADGATSVRSEPTAVVQDTAAGLTNTSRPMITGEARVGQELTATT